MHIYIYCVSHIMCVFQFVPNVAIKTEICAVLNGKHEPVGAVRSQSRLRRGSPAKSYCNRTQFMWHGEVESSPKRKPGHRNAIVLCSQSRSGNQEVS